jgi:uncharacterized repeat protein (TIGR02543 family)
MKRITGSAILMMLVMHAGLYAKFTVAFWGDSRSNGGNAFEEISGYLIAEKGKTVDVHWQNGDFTEGGSTTNWNNSWNIPNVREACAKDYFFMCTSNHDAGSAYQGELVDILPSNGTNCYYSMTSWDIPGSTRRVHLLLFDLYMSGVQEQLDYFTPLLAQVEPIDWIAAMWHAPSFNGMTYKTEEGQAGKDEFMQLLETAATGGDFILNGHAHQYRRTHVLDWNANVLESTQGPGTVHTSPANSWGLVHIVNGRGGVFSSDATGSGWPGNSYAPTLSNSDGLITLMEFDDNQLIMRTIIIGDDYLEKGVQDTWTWIRGDPSGPMLPHSLTVGDVVGGSIIVNPETDTTYAYGTEVELTAVPQDGYLFEGWTGDLTGTANPITIGMTSDRNVSAGFRDCTEGCTFDLEVSSTVTVEENVSSGSVNGSSSDLELPRDGSTEQLVGMSFSGLEIPPGAEITSAYLQFSVDETGSGPVILEVYGDDTDNSTAVSTADGDVSGRTPTDASVTWSPGDWTTVDESGEAQRTPDLSSIIQELVDRDGWDVGNDISLIIGRDDSDGDLNTRTANKSVQLTVAYSITLEATALFEMLNLPVSASAIISGNLDLISYGEIKSVTVYDVSGKKCFSHILRKGQTRVDLRHLEEGRYIIKLGTGGGFITRSIMKYSY